MRESDWLTQVKAHFGSEYKGVVVGIGDDCAILEADGPALISTDTVVEGVHLDPRIMTYEDMGWRALAVALSDLAACGADPSRPMAAFVSVQISRDMPDENLLSFAAGLLACGQAYHCAIAGGDTVSTPGPFAANLTVVGHSEKPALRSGAQVKDLVAVTGGLGWAAAALAAQREGLSGKEVDACLRRFCRPEPLLAIGFELARHATAMIDVSDGLIADLDHICQASRVGARIDLAEVPVGKEADAVLQRVGMDPRVEAATFGDDYQLLFCLPPANWPTATACVPDLTIIGEVTDGDCTTVLRGEKTIDLGRRGYEHGLPDLKNKERKDEDI